MCKAKLVLLSLVVVLSFGAMMASAASAVISFEWRVNSAKLSTGETRAFTGKRDGVVDLSGTVGGQAALLLSNQGTVISGAIIKGGIPGTSEEILELENVTVDRPAKCAVSGGKIRTVPLKGEIVEGAKNKEGNGEVDILVSPKAAEGGGSTLLTTFELVNKGTEECLLKNTVVTASGSLLGHPLPQKTEVLTGGGDEEAPTKEYKNSAGAFKAAGLLFANNPATIKGLVLVTLASDEKAGVF
jgi:hypothetical protein